MKNYAPLTILQINDTHGYLEPHPELFWHGDEAEYRTSGGYARLGDGKFPTELNALMPQFLSAVRPRRTSAKNWSRKVCKERSGSRLQLEWIACGCTAKCFWTGPRRWIAAPASRLR